MTAAVESERAGTPAVETTPVDAPAARRPAARGLASLAGPVMAAIAVQSVANLAFHAVLGRTMAPAEYGALGAVLAAMTLAAVPLTGLQTAAARLAAEHGLSGRTGRLALARTAALIAPVALLLVLVAAPLAAFLHLASWWDAGLLAPTVLVAALLATARGLLLGRGRSRAVASTYVLSTALRLGTGIPLAASIGVTGALLGTALGECAALVPACRWVCPAVEGDSHRFSPGDIARTTAVVTGLFVFTTIDLFLARHYLPAAASGAYVAAATIGKTILALPAAAMSVAYPRLVASWTSGRARPAALRSSLVVVGAPALAGAAVVACAPGLVLGILYGTSFPPGTDQLVRLLAVVAGASAVVSVLAHAGLARGSRNAFVPAAFAVVQALLIVGWHASPLQVAAASGVSLLACLGLLGVVEARRWRRDVP